MPLLFFTYSLFLFLSGVEHSGSLDDLVSGVTCISSLDLVR